ncbi:nucleotidyltransferase domain-containing protein [Clostridium sp.]|uniref:DNA polymerase beta superfamily protein n=1 Tax=Clostridium sp. TaxID=1506 RepID=UPI00261F2F17|nr:nucleotidyltransferase domain-containing protein [Clostridium sp.]
MNIQQMKDKINSKEYDFLRTDKRLKGNIILLTTGGSYAYGTNIDTPEHVSDFDVRGIYTNSKDEILTMNCYDKPIENHELDCTVYPFKQMINLLINANPNTIELLGTKQEQLFICTKEGKLLRDNVDLFLSKRAFNSFYGYAIQQLRRLENSLARDSYPQKEKEKHILGSVNKQMLTFVDRYKTTTDDELKVYIDKSDKELYDEEIFIDLSLKHYPLRDLKGMYAEMSQVINDYDKLNHRNSKKDTIHLLKHSMHLIRLLLMGTEIMQGKGVNTYREKDKELLLDIRNGKYTYEEIFTMVNKYDKEFKYSKDNTELPDNPQYDKINELVMEINRGVLNDSL